MRFPGTGSHLQRYAQRLNCTEINSSFYRSHARATYERWADSVPPTFRFSVKIPKTITHDARLRRARVPLQRFLEEIRGLGRHLGTLLVQLPPSLPFDVKVARRFCALLRQLYRGPVVMEPRHITWFSTSAGRLLAKHEVARVAADPALTVEAALPGGARETLQYYRLHGSPRMYWSNYSRAYLKKLAAALDGKKSSVWVVFDNTAAGCATANALQLRSTLSR
jgi:uncharacterized protein YecE (DUF72 family)